jgi:alkanesulfonate monooxygenase SsuD/methylene tetrahydromethanopterin reductase-like flavin-dependent oxidoreductase (luciferase family)
MPGMRHGLSMPNFAEPQRLIEVATAAERRGWDGFFLWDHIVVSREAPVPVSEPWTVLAAAATATSTIRLGTLVTPVARRRPWVLARQVTTVDHLSGGRAVLGVGLGVPPEVEYGAMGEPADQKLHASLLDEGLELIAALWTGERVEHRGSHHQVTDVQFLPRPLQQPRVPIWIAASLPARAGIRRAARWDGIVPMVDNGPEVRPVTPDEVAAMVADIEARRESDAPFDVVVWAVAPNPALRKEYEQAGVTWLIEGSAPGPGWLEDALEIATGGPPEA